jgi:CubicO group peptidase (beta-lactamase class C family)
MIPTIEPIINAAIEQYIFPGAVVLVARDGEVVHHAAYGTTMYEDACSQIVTTHTIYDIASLTKVFTATAALRLFDQGALDLEQPAAHYLPDMRATNVTVRHLLTHASCLELRLSSLRDHTPEQIRAAIYAVEPVKAPGSETAYVNINSLLLGDIVARVYGAPLDIAINELLLEPLDVYHIFFSPPAYLRPRIAPSEIDEQWRGDIVHGVVNDDSTHALGGVAGHAGLFSTAHDLWRFLQMWLDQGTTARGEQLLRPETVAQATTIQTEGVPGTQHYNPVAPGAPLHAGLGWMIDRPNFMGHAPAGTYGHTGFTGPVVVNVPGQQLSLVILSNRTYPRRTPPAHHAVTAAVLQAVLAAAA